MQTKKRYAALAGAAAAAVALGVGELVAYLFGPGSSPLVAVGDTIIDKVPEWGKELAIRLFGTYDKFALQVGTIVILLGIAALIGLAARRDLRWGFAGIGAFGVIGVFAAVTRVGASVFWALPSLVATAAAVAVMWYLFRLQGAEMPWPHRAAPVLPGDEAEVPGEPREPDLLGPPRPLTPFDRRRFLTATAVAAGGAAVAGYAGRSLSQNSTVEEDRARLVLPAATGRRALSPPGADVAGLSYTVPNNEFYLIDKAIIAPRIRPLAWRLRIHGRVAREMTLTFEDLLRRPMIERYVTLSCVSNEVGGNLVGNAKWLGVPLKDLLEEAGPDPGADQVVSRASDGFSAGSPTKVLLDGRDAMIAIGMNGEPLPIRHGFPARLVVPGLYGYVSATKWVTDIELTTFAAYDAYWVPRGWSQLAPIKTESRIDKPKTGRIDPGQTVIAGVAWAPTRGISKVEVQVDDGPWQVATLGTVASVDTWRLWELPWNATTGDHELRVRATDNAGATQTSERAHPEPDGATGWHTIRVTVA